MPVLETNGHEIRRDKTVGMPMWFIPSCRFHLAVENKCENNFLLETWGGIGDYVCAEPAIRFAVTNFKNIDISLSTHCPELFQHLNFKQVFDLKKEQPDRDKFFCFQTMYDTNSLNREFLAHMFTHCVDYSTINMWRSQIPVRQREILLSPGKDDTYLADALINRQTDVVIHPGQSWDSKTFPISWWERICEVIRLAGLRPVIIGASSKDRKGVLPISAEGCLDLRNKLSIMQTCAVLQTAKVVLTNDSAPLHIAASGQAWIGFFATVKHPELITHWRNGQFGWRMKNMTTDGMWNLIDMCPNNTFEITIDKVEPELLMSWLPKPEIPAHWAIERFSE